MAKYVLNYTKNGPRTVDCAVLDENCLSETYTVQFNNGVIKDVDKKRVQNLDRIDEGVLDRLRNGIDKVKNFVVNLWNRAIKVKNYIVFTFKNKVLHIGTPVNIIEAANQIEGLSFIPSSEIVEQAEAQGIEPTVSLQDEGPEDEKGIKEINDYWKEVISEYKKGGSTNESYKRAYRKIAELNEAAKAEFDENAKLYEAADGKKIELKSESFLNVGTDELKSMILDQWKSYLNGNALKSGTTPVPFVIWGAPGIGKTQIIRKMIEDAREMGERASIIGVNAMSMRKDDWALPGTRTITKTLQAKDKKGNLRDFNLDMAVAAELPKSWLPAWDPNDIGKDEDCTAEMLDDGANGGDGTGNGKGGFFFIDELSRIAPDTLNVIMTLVQSRDFNGLVIGSKWMFIAAANRSEDLGELAAYFKWDKAHTGRFQHVNYVPTFDEWLEWAESPVPGTKRQHILPIYVDFLREHPNLWYNSAACNVGNPKGKVEKTMYPDPRGWENASKGAYDAIEAREADDDEDDFITRLRKKQSLSTKRAKRLTVKELGAKLEQNVGQQPARTFTEWAGFDKIFTAASAKEVWKLGENAQIPFDPNPGTIVAAVNKIFANHPKINQKVSVPGTTIKQVPLTVEELENCLRYIIKCINMVDEDNSGTKDPIIQAVQGAIYNRLDVDLGINIRLPENRKFGKTIESILGNRLGQSFETIVNN